MAGKKGATGVAPIAKLKANLEEKLLQEEDFERRGKVKAPLRDRLTTAQKRDYLRTLEPGGSRYEIIEAATQKTTKPQRIAFVAELMATAEWRSVLNLALSRTWGVSQVTMRNYTAEASRLVHDAFGNREELAATLKAFLENVAHDAFENGDRRSAIGAARTIAEMAGLLVNRTEVSGPGGAPIQHAVLATLSDAELNAKILEAVQEEIAAGRLETSQVKALLQANGAPIPDAEVADETT